MGRCSGGARVAGMVLAAWFATGASAQDAPMPGREPSRDARLRAMQDQIVRLKGEILSLESRESGLLGKVERLEAQLRLREAELAEVGLRIESTERAVADREAALERIGAEQETRRRYLAFRLREIYKLGPAGPASRWIEADASQEDILGGLRYAALLSDRDGKMLQGYRDAQTRLGTERNGLLAERGKLESAKTEAEGGRRALAASQEEQTLLLERIRNDREQHEEALGELESASRELGRLVERLGGQPSDAALDIRKFRGLLDWPADGRVSARFGTAVHPRFKTSVPHPGLDIDAAPGSDIRSIFDGRIAFAGQLHGYGLTAIVDHGDGVVTIYTHASAMLVEAGQVVLRGETLGKVGDSGSVRGPYLYFEIREAGRAVDPIPWLRRR